MSTAAINTQSHSGTSSVEVVPGGPVVGSIRPPGSKSLTNRALMCAAMATGDGDAGTSTLTGALVSEDTEVMIDSLGKIGVRVQSSQGGRHLTVQGRQNGVVDDGPAQKLFIANSGTTIRFLTAGLSAMGGRFDLVGVPRMHERPIGDLVDAIAPVLDGTIRAMSPGIHSSRIHSSGTDSSGLNSSAACPPVEIRSRGWTGAPITVAGGVSSQFLSGLMMAAPASRATANGSTQIRVRGELVSRPYVAMTAAVIRAFGGTVTETAGRMVEEGAASEPNDAIDPNDIGDHFDIGGQYRGTNFAIEPDASAASYFWAAAAITGGEVTVEGLSLDALQGDVAFVHVLERMGCTLTAAADALTISGGPLKGVDVDMNAISDTVQTLAVVALFADGPTRVRGVAHNRYKETDRIGDLACELRRLGARVDEHDDGLTIHPLDQNAAVTPVRLRTYHDHRMAMSLALAGLRIPRVQIDDPACTAKTYPDYWADLERLTRRSHWWRGPVVDVDRTVAPLGGVHE